MAKKTNNKRRDLRFTWSSNAHFTNSGYAVFTRDLLTRLAKDGWPLAEIGFFGVEGYPITLDGIKIYPKMVDPYGGDALLSHSQDWQANAVFTMQDVWTLHPQYLQPLKTWIPYLPIDHNPTSPAIINNLKFAYKIITFSQFGHKELKKQGFASIYIPEGIDVEIFKPMDKQESRKELKLPPNHFLFGMISANKENPPRKGYQQILEAMKLFIDNHPESGIFIHSQQLAPTGFPIAQYAQHLGIANNVFLLDQYSASFRSDSHSVCKEINALDVGMHASMTEGFGLGIVEAQACGKPVIVNNCHSMPELVSEGKTGEICATDRPWWRSQGGYVYLPDVNSLYDKMEKVYSDLQKKNTIAKDTRKNVLTNYSIDSIVKSHWIPFLEDLQEELLPIK